MSEEKNSRPSSEEEPDRSSKDLQASSMDDFYTDEEPAEKETSVSAALFDTDLDSYQVEKARQAVKEHPFRDAVEITARKAPEKTEEPEESEDPEEEKKEAAPAAKEETRKPHGLFQYGVALIGISLIILFFSLAINGIQSVSSKNLTYTLRGKSVLTLSAENAEVWTCGDRIVTFDQNQISAYDLKKKQIWTSTASMTFPRVFASAKYAAMCDIGSSGIVMVDQEGIVYRKNSSEQLPIITGYLTDSGYLALVCGTEASQQIQIYSPDGGLLLKRSTDGLTDGFPNAVALTEEADTLAVASIQYSGSSCSSQVTFFDLRASGSTLKDAVNANYAYPDSIVYTIYTTEKGGMISVSDNKIVSYTRGSVWKEKRKENLKNRTLQLSSSRSMTAILFGMELTPVASGLENKVIVCGPEGEILRTLDEEFDYLQVCGSNLIYSTDNKLYCMDTKGKVQWTYDLSVQPLHVYVMGDAVLLRGKDGLQIMNVVPVEE